MVFSALPLSYLDFSRVGVEPTTRKPVRMLYNPKAGGLIFYSLRADSQKSLNRYFRAGISLTDHDVYFSFKVMNSLL